MNRYIIALLLSSASLAAQNILDEPIKGETPREVFSEMRRVRAALPESDRIAFGDGVTGLTVDVRSWRQKGGIMTETEADRYVFTVVRGMTPRQVIVVGSLMRAMRYREEYLDYKAGRSDTDSKDARLQELRFQADDTERNAADYLV